MPSYKLSSNSQAGYFHSPFILIRRPGIWRYNPIYLFVLYLASDYMLAVKYSDVGGTSFISQSAKLISPPIRITRPSCLRSTLISNANLNISVGYLDNGQYTEARLYSSPLPLGLSWQRLNMDVPVLTSDVVVVVVDTGMSLFSDNALLMRDIILLPGTCRHNG